MLCKDRLGYTGAQAPTERGLQKLQAHSYAHTEILDITLLACFVNSVTKNMRGSYTKCQSSRKLRPELENSLVRCKHGNEPSNCMTWTVLQIMHLENQKHASQQNRTWRLLLQCHV